MDNENPPKIYNIDSIKKVEEAKLPDIVDTETLIKRIDHCAKLEGLKDGYHSSNAEIKEYLKKEGVPIVEVGESLTDQLGKHIGNKYIDFVFDAHDDTTKLKKISLNDSDVMDKELRKKLSDQELLEWQNLDRRNSLAKRNDPSGLPEGFSEKEYTRLLAFREMANPNISYDEAFEMTKLRRMEDSDTISKEEMARLIQLRRRATAAGGIWNFGNNDERIKREKLTIPEEEDMEELEKKAFLSEGTRNLRKLSIPDNLTDDEYIRLMAYRHMRYPNISHNEAFEWAMLSFKYDSENISPIERERLSEISNKIIINQQDYDDFFDGYEPEPLK